MLCTSGKKDKSRELNGIDYHHELDDQGNVHAEPCT